MRRLPAIAAMTFSAVALHCGAAAACEPIVATCLPRVVVFPAYTPEGVRIGTVEARVYRAPALEVSRFTGQPLTVVFNNPRSLPGLVDPDVELMPLPRVPRSPTVAAFPVGY